MADILDDVDLSEMWVRNKISRRSAWNTNKALAIMLGDVMGPHTMKMKRCQIPWSVLHRKLFPHEYRDVRADGICVVDTITGAATPVLPLDFTVPDFTCSTCSGSCSNAST